MPFILSCSAVSWVDVLPLPGLSTGLPRVIVTQLHEFVPMCG